MRNSKWYIMMLSLLLTAGVYGSTSEPYRSVYHHTPSSNWMNDPNGMFYDETTGLWHLYYQHNPFGTTWGPMHWAHSESRDLLHWDHKGIVLSPDSIGTIFSGSAVIDRNNTAGFGKNAVVAVYTQAERIGQHQSIAYSLDGGQTFTPYAGNPVLKGDIADFRDPKVFWDEQSGQWTMILACQQEVRFYGSKNLKEWTLLSRFGKGVGAHGGVWECPDLVKLPYSNIGRTGKAVPNPEWVLLVNINPGGPFGGSATQYFVGEWDGKEFKPSRTPVTKWLDYGKDHYAAVTFHNAPQERCVALGWMSNWQYANQLPTVAFRSQNTIARDLSLYIDDAGESRVRVVPSPESMALKGKKTKQLPACGVVELELCGKKNCLVTLSNDQGEKVVMRLNAKEQTFSMDRSASGACSFSPDFAAVTTTPLFVSYKKHHITLFIDRCSIEAFGTDGTWAMTNLVFPSEPYNRIEVKGGKVVCY